MLILMDNGYKNIISSDYLEYLIELLCIDELLNKEIIDNTFYEKLNVEILNSHIGKK